LQGSSRRGWQKAATSFSILSCGSSVARNQDRIPDRALLVGFQYPILRIVGCKVDGAELVAVAENPFSILSCGSSVARAWGAVVDIHHPGFQYPILRIVGCKPRWA